jgi:S1-C subfamily serine protease
VRRQLLDEIGELATYAGGFLLLIGCALLIAGLSCCAKVEPQAPSVPAHQVQADAAVEITVRCGRLGAGKGSGVVIAPNRVLTASHVIDWCEDGEIKVTHGGGDVGAIVLLADPDSDLASLSVPTVQAGPIRFGPKPEVDSTICLVTRYPYINRSCGMVRGYSDPPGDVKHGATTERGNSGSGVYDEQGRLVGIVTHLMTCTNGQLCGGKFASLEGQEAFWE